MCAEYEIRTNKKRIDEAVQRRLGNRSGKDEWASRIKFTDRAPVIEMGPEGPEIVERVFPSSPFPNARLSGIKSTLQSNEDREISRIYELPTWQEGFNSGRCLVIATSFVEPVYWGDEAGSVMKFQVPDREVFFIAAIAIRPQFPKTGKKDGFALITHAATEQMWVYHHRLVTILSPEDGLEFISGGSNTDPRETFNYLTSHRYTGPLLAERDRTMAKGWEKRVESHLAALAEEKKYVEALKQEGVEG